MPDYPEALVHEVFASAFVDDERFVKRLGGNKPDIATIRRYLSLPIAFRPEVSLFFDQEFYWQTYPDIRAVDVDPLVHFMRWGIKEERNPHPLIDIKFIKAVDPELLPAQATIDALADLLCHDRLDPSTLFSLEYYRSQLDDADLAEGGLLRHFLQIGLLRGLKPCLGFDPIAYYRQVEAKTFDIRSSLRQFASFGNTPQDATNDPISEGQAKALFREKANVANSFLYRFPLRFDLAGAPDISVIIIMHDNFALTLQTLASLRANYTGPLQLILIDSGSTDETQQIAQYVTGGNLLRFDTNICFVRGCNAGLQIAAADVLLYLNNDIVLADGAISAALGRLRSDTSIGAVGAKVIRTHGRLQEAGGIVWQNGWTAGYMRDESPMIPEANFVRDVEFCSAVFLLARTSLVKVLGGFDDAFAPAYFEDVDLCLRIQDASYRVVYDPSVTVHHLEYGTSKTAVDSQNRIRQAHATFLQKHENRLRSNHRSDIRTQLFARSVNQPRGRVLLVEDRLPLRRLGSGFVRSNDIVNAMSKLGFQVTVFPIHPNDQNLASVYADFPDTVEVMHNRALGDLEQFLKLRRGYYDTIWIARSHNVDLIKPMLDRCGSEVMDGVRLILDTEAIAATRQAQLHALFDLPFDMDQAMRQELRNATMCRPVLAVNVREAEYLRILGLPDVRVLGHARPLTLTARGWRQRSGMLFVGAIHTMDSPNYDSLCWFVDEVLPLVEQHLGYETRLTIAGFTAGCVDLSRFQERARITMRGAVADLAPLYDAHRVFIAPTRFAAGLPYKVHEAASHGVPVVATEVLRRQLGWEDGRDLLAADAADPAEFAEHVVALYRSEALWNHIRAGAVARVRAECGREKFERLVGEILG